MLDGVSFQVKQGSIFALLGENGAGKTTTICILTTLIQPDSCRARINGYEIGQHPLKVKESIRLTGQYAAVDEWLTGEENLILMGRLNHLSKREARRRAAELLAQFDLVEAAKRQVKTYSGGMRRRLDLAISLIRTPKVLFLDELRTVLFARYPSSEDEHLIWQTRKHLDLLTKAVSRMPNRYRYVYLLDQALAFDGQQPS